MLPVLERQPAWSVWSGGVLLAGLLTFGAFTAIVLPRQEREAASREMAEQTAEQRAEAQALRQQLAELNGELNETQAALDGQPIELGDRRQLNRQISELIALAQKQGLEVLQLQPGEPMPGEDYTLIPMRLEASASFPQHLDFIEQLHLTFPSISVVGLDLENRTRADAPRPRASFALAWFTAAEDPAIASVPLTR